MLPYLSTLSTHYGAASGLAKDIVQAPPKIQQKHRVMQTAHGYLGTAFFRWE